jgi:hypothetical protein
LSLPIRPERQRVSDKEIEDQRRHGDMMGRLKERGTLEEAYIYTPL